MKSKNLMISACVAGLIFVTPVIAFGADSHGHGPEEIKGHEEKSDHSEASSSARDTEKKGHSGKEADGDHAEGEKPHGSEGHEEKKAEGISLSEAQLREAGVIVRPLQPMQVPSRLNVPGEVLFNQYKTRIVTPRITAMALKREAIMGQQVRKGDVLATLFSVEMAQAQGEYIVASTEWNRVRNIGEKIVSEKRATEARVNQQQAKARLIAYGLTKDQIAALSAQVSLEAPGQFDILADQDGLIVVDDFLVGQVIEPGTPIYKITDPESRWIEARISPSEARLVEPGGLVRVETESTGAQAYEGRVLQIEQQVDEKTRTLGVRIEVIDPQQQLRPGQFVKVSLNGGGHENVLALPKKAVLRGPDGDWTVFQQVSAERFEPVEIRVIRETSGLVVFEGIPVGAKVVTDGAFFVQSELAKSGFSVHNH
ncbi:MAG: efflux RND transporter periplasmic adaptor subunit [Parvibaculaceae bacterium]|jgi:RND family efflux transporter MFP subunit